LARAISTPGLSNNFLLHEVEAVSTGNRSVLDSPRKFKITTAKAKLRIRELLVTARAEARTEQNTGDGRHRSKSSGADRNATGTLAGGLGEVAIDENNKRRCSGLAAAQPLRISSTNA